MSFWLPWQPPTVYTMICCYAYMYHLSLCISVGNKLITTTAIYWSPMSLHWRHNDHDGVSNHQPHGCLLHRLLRRRSEKTSKLRVTGRCAGNSPGPVNSPHKGSVTRKMFPFDDVIMVKSRCWLRAKAIVKSPGFAIEPCKTEFTKHLVFQLDKT